MRILQAISGPKVSFGSEADMAGRICNVLLYPRKAVIKRLRVHALAATHDIVAGSDADVVFAGRSRRSRSRHQLKREGCHAQGHFNTDRTLD